MSLFVKWGLGNFSRNFPPAPPRAEVGTRGDGRLNALPEAIRVESTPESTPVPTKFRLKGGLTQNRGGRHKG